MMEKPEEQHVFEVFPNPSDAEAFFFIRFEKPQSTRVLLKDISGRHLRRWDSNGLILEWGEKINLSNLALGVYFLQLILNEWQMNKRLAVY